MWTVAAGMAAATYLDEPNDIAIHSPCAAEGPAGAESPPPPPQAARMAAEARTANVFFRSSP